MDFVRAGSDAGADHLAAVVHRHGVADVAAAERAEVDHPTRGRP